ncbi:MAG TPA: extracellular solute-binding protein [Actinomycetes bacterium]|nr:extracellular solute-binding protein [Actinomycetes bacterium]
MSKRRFPRWVALVAGVSLLAAACGGGGSKQTSQQNGGKSHQGVSVTVLTFTGPQIAEPLQRRAPDFQRLTGANIKVVTVPFSDLYDKILTDMATNTNSYDAFVFDPQWMGDFVPPGYLEDITDRVKGDQALKWDDIAPFFRDFSASYKGRTYTVPLDGDFQMVYYRSDLLKRDGLQPPATWDDYLSIAQRYNRKDLNKDGKPDYGSCIAKKRAAQSYWMFWSMAASYLQSQGTSQGSFFDANTMKPLVNNEAVATALDVYKKTTQYAPPDELNLDVGDTRGLFTSGRCALSVDWGDIGTLAIDPKTSTVQDKVGSVILPGSKRVLDRASGKLVDCNPTICPHAVNGINHAPFSAYGGWSGAINASADDKVKDAAFDFLAYMSAPQESNVDVTLGKTGFNPYRTSQFQNVDAWVKAGMSKAAAQNYLGAIRDSLQSPNMVLDLRVPKSAQYEGVALDQALAQYLAGEVNLDQTMKNLEAAWEKITNDEGRDQQKQAYAASLNIQR